MLIVRFSVQFIYEKINKLINLNVSYVRNLIKGMQVMDPEDFFPFLMPVGFTLCIIF